MSERKCQECGAEMTRFVTSQVDSGQVLVSYTCRALSHQTMLLVWEAQEK